MALLLELTPEQERRLEDEAARHGLDAASYAKAMLFDREQSDPVALVDNEAAELPAPGSMTPAEIVAYWEREGVLRPRPDLPDSPIYAHQLREQAQKRVRD